MKKVISKLLKNNLRQYCSIIRYLTSFSENNLKCSIHSGFRLGASYINQLLSISHETFSAFEIGLEIWGLFLNILNGFDKVWHVRLIHKLHQNDTCGSMVNILNDFLINRKERVVLYRVFFSWVDIQGEVPQDFMLGLFCYWYMQITSEKVLKKNLSLFSVVHDVNNSVNNINKDLELISKWSFSWRIS